MTWRHETNDALGIFASLKVGAPAVVEIEYCGLTPTGEAARPIEDKDEAAHLRRSPNATGHQKETPLNPPSGSGA